MCDAHQTGFHKCTQLRIAVSVEAQRVPDGCSFLIQDIHPIVQRQPVRRGDVSFAIGVAESRTRKYKVIC